MKYKSRAFTLLEILVVIAVIWILWVSISRLNFSRISQEELIAIESIKMIASAEEMRDNALVGKSENIWWDIPRSWNIEFNRTTGRFVTSYTDSGGSVITIKSQDIRSPFEILSIYCRNLNWSISGLWNIIWINFLTTSETNINWCTISNPRIIDIEIGRWDIRNTIRINTLTNVVEEL